MNLESILTLLSKGENMICKHYHEEFCTNDQCPMRADYCPVPDSHGVCKYEELIEDEVYTLTPQGCLRAALTDYVELDDTVFESIWSDFSELMFKCGYTKEVEED